MLRYVQAKFYQEAQDNEIRKNVDNTSYFFVYFRR